MTPMAASSRLMILANARVPLRPTTWVTHSARDRMSQAIAMLTTNEASVGASP
jgi:hypothetical protein